MENDNNDPAQEAFHQIQAAHAMKDEMAKRSLDLLTEIRDLLKVIAVRLESKEKV